MDYDKHEIQLPECSRLSHKVTHRGEEISGSIMGITTLDVVLPNPMSSVWRKALVEKVEGEDRTMKDLLLEEDQLWG